MSLNPSPYSLSDIPQTYYLNPETLLSQALRYAPGEDTPERIELPHRPRPDTLLEASIVSPTNRRAVPLAVATARRITPWCSVTVTPSLLLTQARNAAAPAAYVLRDGQRFGSWGGVFHAAGQEIVFACDGNPLTFLSVAAHEAWHALEQVLTDETKDAIMADLGPQIVGQGDPYHADSEERRACAFQIWCYRVLAGMPAFESGSDLDRIFRAAWEGKIGKEIADSMD